MEMVKQQNFYEVTRLERLYKSQYSGFIQLYNDLNRDFKSFSKFIKNSKGQDLSNSNSNSRRDIAIQVRNKFEVVQFNHSQFSTCLKINAYEVAQIIIDYLVYAIDFARYAYDNFFNRNDKKLRNWTFATRIVQAATVGLGSSVAESIAPGGGRLYSMAATGINSLATQAMEVGTGSREKLNFEEIAFEVGISYTLSSVTNMLPKGHSILPDLIKNSNDYKILISSSSKDIALSVLKKILVTEVRPH